MNAIVKPVTEANPLSQRSIVIVGMPGAGKSSVGRKLAARLGLPFIDSDDAVEAAAGMTVEQIFDQLGEPAFREGERKVIARLLNGPPCVLATGGGAFMNESTRKLVHEKALSLWLRAELAVLLERTSRRDDRPLLKKGDPGKILQELMLKREPFYATAKVAVTSDKRPLDNMVDRVLKALKDYVAKDSTSSLPDGQDNS